MRLNERLARVDVLLALGGVFLGAAAIAALAGSLMLVSVLLAVSGTIILLDPSVSGLPRSPRTLAGVTLVGMAAALLAYQIVADFTT